ncbi:hypothetical protein M1N58_01140 [Dehalococcoidales bacterium]|nr:hypothetical protein [Dehalococcoidales bacterium]
MAVSFTDLPSTITSLLAKLTDSLPLTKERSSPLTGSPRLRRNAACTLAISSIWLNGLVI